MSNQVKDFNQKVLYGTKYQITNLNNDTSQYEIDTSYKPSFNDFNNPLSGTTDSSPLNNKYNYKYINITLSFKIKS